MDGIKILGIVGSLRKDSYNRLALKAAQELLPAGVLLSLFELHGIRDSASRGRGTARMNGRRRYDAIDGWRQVATFVFPVTQPFFGLAFVQIAAKDLGGKVQEEFGKLTSSSEQQAKGLKNQAEGKVQGHLGDLKETVKKAPPPSRTPSSRKPRHATHHPLQAGLSRRGGCFHFGEPPRTPVGPVFVHCPTDRRQYRRSRESPGGTE